MGNCRCCADSCINGNILVIVSIMKIVSAAEQKNFEKRVAITPETAKKYISIGMDVFFTKKLWFTFRF